MRPCAGAGSGDFAGARGKWAAAPKRCAGRKMGTGSRAMRRCLYPFSGDRIAQSPVDGGAVQMRPPFCDIPAAAASCALFCPRMTRHGDLIHTGGRATSATQQAWPRLLATAAPKFTRRGGAQAAGPTGGPDCLQSPRRRRKRQVGRFACCSLSLATRITSNPGHPRSNSHWWTSHQCHTARAAPIACNRRAEVYPPWRGASGRWDGSLVARFRLQPGLRVIRATRHPPKFLEDTRV